MFIARRMINSMVPNKPKPQYVCRVDSVSEACPTVPVALGKQELDLSVPPDARWLFVGPSYMVQIFRTITAANGGCTSSPVCQLSNGAKLAIINEGEGLNWPSNEGDKVAFALEDWNHGVYMQPHNKAEYEAEHDRAASQGRGADPSKFLDPEGRDMCIPSDSEGAIVSNATSSSYQACMDRRDELRAFDALLGGAKKRLVVAPWHVVPPLQSTVPGTYFARERAKTIDCYADLQPLQHTPDGFMNFGISLGKQRNLREHQCAAVCEFEGAAMSVCDPGSIIWIAHDILALLSA